MKSKYKEWIDKNYPTYQSALAQCVKACKDMVIVFPELKTTNGFAHFIHCEPRAHWWCKDPEGNIVDPTAHQFPKYLGSPIMDYEEIDDNHPARMYAQAKCMNCGEYYYETPELRGVLHNKRCENEFINYLNGSL
jgi:hypothetical protein